MESPKQLEDCNSVKNLKTLSGEGLVIWYDLHTRQDSIERSSAHLVSTTRQRGNPMLQRGRMGWDSVKDNKLAVNRRRTSPFQYWQRPSSTDPKSEMKKHWNAWSGTEYYPESKTQFWQIPQNKYILQRKAENPHASHYMWGWHIKIGSKNFLCWLA